MKTGATFLLVIAGGFKLLLLSSHLQDVQNKRK
jgi:hypothetical protein